MSRINFLSTYNHMSTTKYIVLFIGILAMTLSSIYFFQIGFNIVQVFGLLLLVYIGMQYTILERRNIRYFLVFLVFFSLNTYWGLMAYVTKVQIKGLLGFVLGSLLFVFVLSFESHFVKRVICVLNIILLMHVILWIIQFSVFHINNEFIDYIKPLTGQSTRNFNTISDYYVIRFSGLFVEPGMYATFSFMGLYLRFIINQYKLKTFDYIIIITIIFSFSTFGYFLVFVFSLVYLIKNRIRRIVWYLIIFILLIFIFHLLFPEEFNIYYIQRLSNPIGDSSGQARLVYSFDFLLNEIPLRGFLFGVGIGNYELSSGVSNGLVYLLEHLGIIGMLVFCFLIFMAFFRLKSRVGINILAFLAVIMGGAPFTDIYWWFWMGLICTANFDIKKLEQSIPKKNLFSKLNTGS